MARLEDLPEAHLAKGQVGTLVDELDRECMLGEFADINGIAYAIQLVPCSLLMPLHHQPALAA